MDCLEDMLLIYDMCRYQKAWNLEQVSPWCAAFTSENLKVNINKPETYRPMFYPKSCGRIRF